MYKLKLKLNLILLFSIIVLLIEIHVHEIFFIFLQMNHHVHSYAKNCFISWHWTYVFISILVDGFCTGFSNIFISQGPSLCLLFIWNTGINLVKKQFILNTCNMHNCKNSIMHICLRNIFSTMQWIHIQT